MTVRGAQLADALAELAVTFERDENPIQAIHCLQALVDQKQTADREAIARLHLGRLLLQHTVSLEDAQKILLKAQWLCNSLIGNYCLKYEVHDQLATCYHYMGKEAMEQQVYGAVADLWKSARGSDEWLPCLRWACRLLQRSAALAARGRRHGEARRAAEEGLALAEAHGLRDQKVIFLLLCAQLALCRWDHPPVDAAFGALSALLAPPQGQGPQQGGQLETSPLGMDAGAYPHVLLHYNLLQALYMLRVGKLTDLTKQQQQQQPAAAGGAGGGAPPGEVLPPVLQHLVNTLAHIDQERERKRQEQQQQLQQATPVRGVGRGGGALPPAYPAILPYCLPGLPTLEPLVRLVCALTLRAGSSWPSLPEQQLERGLQSTTELLAAVGLGPNGVDLYACGAPAPAAATPSQQQQQQQVAQAQEQGKHHVVQLEGCRLEAARPVLQLHMLLMACRAQLLLSKARLVDAREVLLGCQQLLERHQPTLATGPGGGGATGAAGAAVGGGGSGPPSFGLLPGLHLLTGQYCVATGEYGAAAAHFEIARQHAPSNAAAALAAVLRAEALLSEHRGEPGGGVAAALAALGPYYMPPGGDAVLGAAAAGGGGEGPACGPLGHLEVAACQLASAACLVEQGQHDAANQMLSKALKLAHRRLGHSQLVVTILNELVPTFLLHSDLHSASEAANSCLTFAAATGDPWGEAAAKHRMAAILNQQGEAGKAAQATASARRREERVRVAAAEAMYDTGRHEYAVGWGLMVRQGAAV